MPLNSELRFAWGTLIAVAINWAAWAGFLITTPQVKEAEFQEVAAQRARRDAGAMYFMTDQPTIVAARKFGGFRPLPMTERLLVLMAGVPMGIAERYVVPPLYLGDPPTRAESQDIAVIGFTLSTAFWATVGGV